MAKNKGGKPKKEENVGGTSEQGRQQQLESARQMGVPESEVPLRSRGGFRHEELRTIPANITQLKVQNTQAFQSADLLCNYVAITPMSGRIVHMYRVDFSPAIESGALMKRLFSAAAGKLFTSRPVYDGVHECRSGQKLDKQTTETEVAVQDAGEKVYKVTLTYTGTTQYGAEMLRLYNMHIKEFLRKMGYYSPQPGLFVHPQQLKRVGSEIVMLRGFSTAANLHEGNKMLMNFNSAHKLVQTSNVLRMMSTIRERNPAANLQEAIRAELTGKLVVTSYDHKAYRIEGVDFASNPMSKFERRTGGPISFVDYYKSVHNLKVQDPKQPLLVVVPNNTRRRGDEGDKPDIKLIPEFCNIAGLTDAQANDGRLRRDLISASQIPPSDHVEHLRKFLKEFHQNPEVKAQLSQWGYAYGQEPVKIKGHILPPTMVGFGPAAQRAPTDWFRSNPTTADFNVTGLAAGPAIRKMVILIPRLRQPAERGEILQKLKQGFDRVGLRVANDAVSVLDMNGDSPAEYIKHLRNIASDVTVTVVVMSRQNKERYDAIKKAASCEMGKITQVVTAQLLCDPRKSGGAATKIAIQIAAKIGGEPWWVDIPSNLGAMVCGYDTYHDTAQRGRSFGAFVASMNNRFSRWFSKADAHDKMDEMSTQISTNMRQALIEYQKLNKKFPERVIIYRDGVGEGQLNHVYHTEMKQIKETIKSIDSKIKLTVIIVSKRIGARFYMKTGQGFINPPPGTVIDNTITREVRFDFYLISQSTRQGTITPTYYNIIEDEILMPVELYQRLAYKFTLLYYNWSGSVRVPAPCQYAHKLALLCGEHLHAQPNANLDKLLHFL